MYHTTQQCCKVLCASADLKWTEWVRWRRIVAEKVNSLVPKAQASIIDKEAAEQWGSVQTFFATWRQFFSKSSTEIQITIHYNETRVEIQLRLQVR